MFEYGFIVSADALGQMIFSPIFGLMADKLNSIRLVSLICCITFSLGNLFYANISVVPKTLGSIPLARMYALILARFIVGNVMITLLLILGSSKGEKMFPSHCQYTDDLLVVFTLVITLRQLISYTLCARAFIREKNKLPSMKNEKTTWVLILQKYGKF